MNKAQTRLSNQLKDKMKQQFNAIFSLHARNRSVPISYAQVFFVALCLVDNSPKNEVTGRYLWGEIDLEQLISSYNQVLQEHDIFHFQFHKYLPLAKIKKPEYQTIILYDLSDKSRELQLQEINEKCRELETMDLRFNKVCHSIIIKLDTYKYLMLSAFSHTLIDTTSKNLFWHYLLNSASLNQPNKTKIPSYLDYIAVERAFHSAHLKEYKSMLDVSYDEIPVALFSGELFDAQTQDKTKERYFFKINRDLASHLKSYAQQQKMTLETLLIGIFLKSMAAFMVNDIALVQNINVSVYPELFDKTCGPHLQESILIFKELKTTSIESIAAQAQMQIWSMPFHSLPFSFGLGLILDKHLKRAHYGARFLFGIARLVNSMFLRKLFIPNDILSAYRGLLKFDSYNHKNTNKLIILNFNFRYDMGDELLSDKTIMPIYAERSFIHPFYTKPNDYLVFNFDRDEDDGILFHLESPFSDTVNSNIANECISNLEKTKTR